MLYRKTDSFTDVRALQDDLQLLELWEKEWKMSFNIDKCMVISITLKQTPVHTNYTLHGKQLTMVECAISIDYYLLTSTWTMRAKRQTVLSFVRRNFANCSRKIKEDLYLHIMSNPLWNMQLQLQPWAPYNSRQSINKLESVQRRAAHFVMHDYYQTSSVSNMLLCLNWNTMEKQHFKHLRLQMLHKIIHSSVDVSLPSYITHT